MYMVHSDSRAVPMLTTMPALSPVLEMAFCAQGFSQACDTVPVHAKVLDGVSRHPYCQCVILHDYCGALPNASSSSGNSRQC